MMMSCSVTVNKTLLLNLYNMKLILKHESCIKQSQTMNLPHTLCFMVCLCVYYMIPSSSSVIIQVLLSWFSINKYNYVSSTVSCTQLISNTVHCLDFYESTVATVFTLLPGRVMIFIKFIAQNLFMFLPFKEIIPFYNGYKAHYLTYIVCKHNKNNSLW